MNLSMLVVDGTAVSPLALEAASEGAFVRAQAEKVMRGRVFRTASKKNFVKSSGKIQHSLRAFIKRRPELQMLPVESSTYGRTRDLTEDDLSGFDLGL